MIPWVRLDAAILPDGTEMRLSQRGTEFSIRVAGAELMNSRLSGSEEALATLCAERLKGRGGLHCLVGGLGMGFTLKAARLAFPPETRFTVAELVPAVVAWARGPLATLCAESLADPRVSLHVGDVGRLIASAPATFDAIMLDVDNGPEAMTTRENDALYGHAGLALARAALRPGGVLAVWSSGPDPSFARRLRDVGLSVEEARIRADRGRRGVRHVIWLATRPAGATPKGAPKAGPKGRP